MNGNIKHKYTKHKLIIIIYLPLRQPYGGKYQSIVVYKVKIIYFQPLQEGTGLTYICMLGALRYSKSWLRVKQRLMCDLVQTLSDSEPQ